MSAPVQSSAMCQCGTLLLYKQSTVRCADCKREMHANCAQFVLGEYRCNEHTETAMARYEGSAPNPQCPACNELRTHSFQEWRAYHPNPLFRTNPFAPKAASGTEPGK